VSATLAQRNAKKAAATAELAVNQVDALKESLNAHRKATANRFEFMTGVDQSKLDQAQRRIEELEIKLLDLSGPNKKPPGSD
jgi:hypothetical protein